MFDRWICARAKDDFSGEYMAGDAVVAARHLNPDASDLKVVFPHWHASETETNLLHRRLSRQNSVLHYYLHDRILEPNRERVRDSFDVISKRAAADLSIFEEEGRYRSIELIGISLGNVALAKTATLFPNFDSATLVVAGSSLADCMWEGARTRNLRSAFEHQQVSQSELRVEWADLAPSKHAPSFHKKQVKAIVSKRDSIIPTSYQIEMVQKLEEARAEVTGAYTVLDHSATLTRFCIKG